MANHKGREPIHALRQWFNYDPVSGVLIWRMSNRYVTAGERAGSVVGKGYRSVRSLGKNYPEHQLVWALHYGEWPDPSRVIDHINGDKSDNSISNLRLATITQNAANSKRRAVNTSGFKGVCWHKRDKVWLAHIGVNGKNLHLGTFTSKERAFEAYRDAAVRHFGEYANFGT